MPLCLFALTSWSAEALPKDVNVLMAQINEQRKTLTQTQEQLTQTQQDINLFSKTKEDQLQEFQRSLMRTMQLSSAQTAWTPLFYPEQAPLLRYAQKGTQENLQDTETALSRLFIKRQQLKTHIAELKKGEQDLLDTQKTLLTKLKIHPTKIKKRLDSLPKRKASKTTKSSISIPIQGIVLSSFGRKNKQGVRNKGVTLQGVPKGTVRTLTNGTVLYADDFRDYGGLMIIAEGDRQFIYGGLSSYRAQVGDSVKAKQAIGTLSSDDSPQLYIEMRVKEKTKDPITLIRSFSK